MQTCQGGISNSQGRSRKLLLGRECILHPGGRSGSFRDSFLQPRYCTEPPILLIAGSSPPPLDYCWPSWSVAEMVGQGGSRLFRLTGSQPCVIRLINQWGCAVVTSDHATWPPWLLVFVYEQERAWVRRARGLQRDLAGFHLLGKLICIETKQVMQLTDTAPLSMGILATATGYRSAFSVPCSSV